MEQRIAELEITHRQKESPDLETERIKADILKLYTEIRSLIDRMVETDDVVFIFSRR